MAGGKGQNGQMTANKYRMSIHMGVCAGPIDALLAIIVGQKVGWSGEVTVNGHIHVDNLQLFGGLREQGGLQGDAYLLRGTDTQFVTDSVASNFGLTQATCPGFRGLCSIVFTDGPDLGFYWTANSPYLQDVWIKLRRQPKGLSTAYDPAPTDDGYADANPASMIYECLTDTDWGMGADSSLINVISFNTAAQTLFDENFFLSMQWSRSDTIENFISEILGHIDGMVFTNPLDGLLTLKLLRNDYDHDTVPTLDPSNSTITNFKRKLYGETTNEIVVTYTNPNVTDQKSSASTITVQDLANIAVQGGEIVSDNRNYYGVTNPLLATQLGLRDLRRSSLPLLGCEIEVDRSQWGIVPGHLRKLSWPEPGYGVVEVLMRVLKVDYGKPGDAKIKLTLAQDIFGLATQEFDTEDVGSGEWVDPDEDPRDIDYCKVITAPSFLLAQNFGDDPTFIEDSEVLAAVLAAQDSPDTWRYDLHSITISALGTAGWGDLGTRALVGTATLAGVIPAEATTIIPAFGYMVRPFPKVGDYVFIGNEDTGEDIMEIAVVTAIDDDTGAYTLYRGLCDTTPKSWLTGTRVWFFPAKANIFDKTYRGEGETVGYRVLPRTSKGMLDISAATTHVTTLSNRPHFPIRPANVQIEGQGFGLFDATGLSTANITWSNRNRLTETAQILPWGAATTTPEVGQTTTIRYFDEFGGVIGEVADLTGTSYPLALSVFGSSPFGSIQVLAVRDGEESLQGHRIPIAINPTAGYGGAYGTGYGGGIAPTGYGEIPYGTVYGG